MRWSYHFRFLDEVAQVSSVYPRFEIRTLFKFLDDILRIRAITLFLYRLFQADAQASFASVGFIPSMLPKRCSLSFTEPHFLSSFYASRAYRKTENLLFFSWFDLIHRSLLATIPRMRTALMDDVSHVTSVLHSYR